MSTYPSGVNVVIFPIFSDNRTVLYKKYNILDPDFRPVYIQLEILFRKMGWP